MTKTCIKCECEFPATAEFFHRKNDARDGLRTVCKSCAKALHAVYYEENRDRLGIAARRIYYANPRAKLDAAKVRYQERRIEIRARANLARFNSAPVTYFREWREQGCRVCAVTDYRIVQAHHMDPSQKDVDASTIVRSCAGIANLEALTSELAKCIPLCANHHILVHEELRNGHKGCALDEVIEYLKEMSHV